MPQLPGRRHFTRDETTIKHIQWHPYYISEILLCRFNPEKLSFIHKTQKVNLSVISKFEKKWIDVWWVTINLTVEYLKTHRRTEVVPVQQMNQSSDCSWWMKIFDWQGLRRWRRSEISGDLANSSSAYLRKTTLPVSSANHRDRNTPPDIFDIRLELKWFMRIEIWLLTAAAAAAWVLILKQICVSSENSRSEHQLMIST